MRRARRIAWLAGALVAFAAPAMADMSSMPSGMTASVSLLATSYQPQRITILTGDTVNWSDISREHTVSAEDDSWSSPHLFYGDNYSRSFDTAGVVHYYCRIHPFMQGEVDVYDVLLDTPAAPSAPNRPIPLRGRAALPEGTEISIEGDSGSGFVPVTSAVLATDGSFVATVAPSTTTTYRAVAGTAVSPPVLQRVIDRKVVLSDVRRNGRDQLTVTVTPASPGATVVLQLYLRERFGWWPQLQARLNRASSAHFVIRLDRRVLARAALTLPDGATQLALSPTLRIGPRH